VAYTSRRGWQKAPVKNWRQYFLYSPTQTNEVGDAASLPMDDCVMHSPVVKSRTELPTTNAECDTS
jgi:hypothetical protein